MSSIYDWSTTPANNATADANINWAEGQAPSTVNNSARVMMERTKELISDLGAINTVGGTANSITVTATSPFSAYSDGIRIAFKATNVNTGAATLNANSVGAKTIRKFTAAGEVDVSAGDIQTGRFYEVVYFAALNSAAGGWMLVNPQPVWDNIGVFSGSGAASLNIINLASYRAIRFSGMIFPSTTAAIYMRVSNDNGATWLSGASEYITQYTQSAGVGVSSNVLTTNNIALATNNTVALTGGIELSNYCCPNFNVAGQAMRLRGQSGLDTGSLITADIFAYSNTTTARNGIQFYPSTGTITYYVIVEGIRG